MYVTYDRQQSYAQWMYHDPRIVVWASRDYEWMVYWGNPDLLFDCVFMIPGTIPLD